MAVSSAILSKLKAKANPTAPTTPTATPKPTAPSPNIQTLRTMAGAPTTQQANGAHPGYAGTVQYGANVANYDPSNATHRQLADAGASYAQAYERGDQAGMDAARALGQQIRSSSGLANSYNDRTGTTSFANPTNSQALSNASSTSTDNIQRMRDLAAKNATQQAYDARNQADATNLDNARRLNELMANRGLGSSGENITAQLQQAAQRANALYDINNNLNTNLNNLDINMANQLQQQSNIDADRALQTAQLTGLLNGQQTLAGQAQQWGQGMDVANLLGTFGGQRTLAGQSFDQGIKNDNLNAALQVGQQTGYNVTPQNDYAGLFRQVSQGTNAQGNPLTRNLSGQTFDSNEQQRGIDNAYREQQAAIDQAYQNNQLSLQQAQEARLQLQQDYDEAYRRYGIQSGGNSQYSGLTPNQVLDSIQSQFKDDKGKIPAANKQSVYEAIIDAGLTDAQTDQLLAVSGLTKKEIEAFNKQYGVGE